MNNRERDGEMGESKRRKENWIKGSVEEEKRAKWLEKLYFFFLFLSLSSPSFSFRMSERINGRNKVMMRGFWWIIFHNYLFILNDCWNGTEEKGRSEDEEKETPFIITSFNAILTKLLSSWPEGDLSFYQQWNVNYARAKNVHRMNFTAHGMKKRKLKEIFFSLSKMKNKLNMTFHPVARAFEEIFLHHLVYVW